ncbi:hypothetical protein [Rossellomorea marisflavi]|uniref:hypothetical protein n=1 Tax=Rossellomorea marisflavi TaxID=189381 RepID=UPI003458BD1D
MTTAIISEEPVNLRARYDRMPNKKTTPTYIKKIVPNLDFEGLSIPYATASEYKCGNKMEDITIIIPTTNAKVPYNTLKKGMTQ